MWQSTASRRQFLPSWCIVIIRTKSQGSLTLENLNPNIIKLQYAVRGPLVIRAAALIKELAGGSSKPFNKVILANVGDAQAMKQPPITFIRQVVACTSYPKLIESGSMPADVKQRAKDILKSCAGQSVGAYTMSHGIELIRRHVAEYIEQRDGHKANWQDICLTAGASAGIKHVLELFCNKVDCKPTGIMIPIPQYPLYSATLTEFGIGHIRYFLDEDKGWALDINELERSFTEGSKTHAVRAIVVINPGNPTGQVHYTTPYYILYVRPSRFSPPFPNTPGQTPPPDRYTIPRHTIYYTVRAIVVINPGNPTGQVHYTTPYYILYVAAIVVMQPGNPYRTGTTIHAIHIYTVRAIVVINPGNPTGQPLCIRSLPICEYNTDLISFCQVLKRGNIEEIIKFAHKKNLLIFADEVYQANVYDKDSKFFSFKKVMTELGAPYACCELASFMSISKGYTGECGLRGGWMELVNMDPKVQEHLYKAMSAMLCPPTIGQIVCDCVAKTPCCGEPSYDLWEKERCAVLDSLKERSEMIVQAFNGMKGFKCNTVQGAMYAFPRIELSSKAIEAAKAAGKAPDVFYAFKLLEDCGICIVPGTGFGQKPGTWHFRTTILPQKPLLKEMLDIFQKFHQKFSEQYA
ncbi:hypothetical protein SFRURICE_003260 [Spodoptera frugiperda]|nr:hypothetical protein SFRURICE_003260 [Spodoptera frugiperda]